MGPATVVTSTVAGTTPTVVIANAPANAHLPLPIGKIFKYLLLSEVELKLPTLLKCFSLYFAAQLIPSGVKGLTQQNMRSNNAAVALSQVTYYLHLSALSVNISIKSNVERIMAISLVIQGGQAIQLVGSQRSRLNQMTRQAQSNQSKGLSNQLASKGANQLVLSRNKQLLAPIMGRLLFRLFFREKKSIDRDWHWEWFTNVDDQAAASQPMLMATQSGASSSSQSSISGAPTSKQQQQQTLLAKSLHARSAAAATMGQCNSQAQQALNATVAGLSQQQVSSLVRIRSNPS